MSMASKAIKPVSISEAVLNDLASRFLLNIPKEDQDDPMKLCTHIELAYWFYLDLIRPEDSTLPGCSMKEFMAAMFHHCPFLVKDSVMVDLDNYVAQWKAHKYKRPVRGGIILNQNLTKCLLVQGYPASTTWGFPKGKLEEGEDDMDAAVRELFEETGFDSRGIIHEEWYLEAQVNGCEAKMYIIPGVLDSTHFEPKTRKEIRDIQWFRIDDLPRHKKDLTSKQALGKSANSFFMIIPFISQLKKWISTHSKGFIRASKGKTISAHFQNPTQQQQQQFHSQNLMSAQNVQSNLTFLPMAQAQSMTVAPSAPPLTVISHGTQNYEAALQYGMGHPNETREHRIPRMGLGNVGMYDVRMEMHNYLSHRENQSPHHPNLQPTVPACSRDDTAPIPYPPQHPHTLHPNHTLPAPLHHLTTGHYSPGHTAVYPSHLAYTTTPHSPHHQLHEQQHPQHMYNNQQELYVQPPSAVLKGDGDTAQLTQQSSPQRRPDFNLFHDVGSHHMQKMVAYATKSPAVAGASLTTLPGTCRPTGNLPSPQSRSTAYPVAAARWPPQTPHHTSHATPRQQFQHHNLHPGQVAPTPQLPPTPAHPYYHIPGEPHKGNPQGVPLHQEGEPHHAGQPQPHYGTNGEVGRSHEQQKYKAMLAKPKCHVPQSHEKETIASGVEALTLTQEGASHHQAPFGHRVTLKPAASMVRFRFNKEAILKVSNIRSTI